MKLTLYFMGAKGLSVLQALYRAHPEFVGDVVGAEDKQVSDDGADTIKVLSA